MEIKNSKLKMKSKTGKFFILYFTFIILFVTQIESAPFTDNSDGTVKDNATGLIWQKCSRGQGATDCSGTATTTTWANAITYCSGLSLASKTWRLPTINELKTIVDTTKTSSPAIDTAAFPSTVASNYWSSTTYAPGTSVAWSVNVGNGAGYGNVKTSNSYVRCVSGP